MLGVWSQWSAQFLCVVGAFTLIGYGLPLLIAPLRWANWLDWRLPAETELAVYFGRCVGAFAAVLGLASILIALRPDLQPAWFGFLVANGAGMIAVHVHGALRRTQPLSETVEILLWLALTLLALAFWPSA